MRMQLSIQDPDLMVCYIHFIMQETLFIKRNVAIRAAALSLLSFLGLVKYYGFSNNFSLFIAPQANFEGVVIKSNRWRFCAQLLYCTSSAVQGY